MATREVVHGPRDIPPVRMKWGHLCQDVQFKETPRGESATISQIIHNLGRPPRARKFELGCLALMFDASGTEAETQTLTVSLQTYPNDQPVDSRDIEIHFHSIGEGYRRPAPTKIPLQDWALPDWGDYSFHFHIGDISLGELPFRLFGGPNQSILPPPARQGAPNLEVKWAHLLTDARGFRTGTLADIVEFIRLPRASSMIDMSGSTLVAHCMWRPVDGAPIARDLRIRFLNGHGRNVFPQGDLRTQLEMDMFSENRLARRNSAALGNASLPMDDYTFEFYLDGHWMHTLDFYILGPSH
jgi:hypothetical protein